MGTAFSINLFMLKKWMHVWPNITVRVTLDSLVPVYRDVHSSIVCIRRCNVTIPCPCSSLLLESSLNRLNSELSFASKC